MYQFWITFRNARHVKLEMWFKHYLTAHPADTYAKNKPKIQQYFTK